MQSSITVRSILVVEDDPEIQKLIKISLRLRGVKEVWAANDGVECIEVVDQLKPDLILLDVSMPRLDGYETCRLLKAKPGTRGIPVIFLSAKTQNDEQEMGLNAGASGYLSKPFDPTTLYSQILEILEGQTT
jgi:CheY-like chemotaxis protein